MSPTILTLKQSDTASAAIQQAAALLRDGQVIGLPTETVYGLAAHAFQEAAVQRLVRVKNRPASKPLALALHSRQAAFAFVPHMSPLGRRVSKRCWPGPMTLVFAGALDQGAGRDLPPAVRAAVSVNGDLGIRVPSHWATLEVIRLSGGPLVLTSANPSGSEEPSRADQVAAAFGREVALVLDDGQTLHGRSSTVVRINGDRWWVLREGIVSPATVRRLTTQVILFVCTGNTCRSPMAEAIAKALLAERLGCAPDALEEQGYCVMSAGVSTVMGCPVSPDAVTVLAEMGLKPDTVGSQPLSASIVDQSDQIWVMTESHRRAVLSLLSDPEEADKVRLLDPQGEDIPDPLGGSTERYRACAARIRECIQHHLPKMMAP